MTFTLPNLPYEYNALEPHIDEQTMHVHHDKHHQAYVDKLNKAVEGIDLGNKTIQEILSSIDELPQDKQDGVIQGRGLIGYVAGLVQQKPNFLWQRQDILATMT